MTNNAGAAAMEAELARTGQLRIFKPVAPEDIESLPLEGTCQKCRQRVDLKREVHRCGG